MLQFYLIKHGLITVTNKKQSVGYYLTKLNSLPFIDMIHALGKSQLSREKTSLNISETAAIFKYQESKHLNLCRTEGSETSNKTFHFSPAGPLK